MLIVQIKNIRHSLITFNYHSYTYLENKKLIKPTKYYTTFMKKLFILIGLKRLKGHYQVTYSKNEQNYHKNFKYVFTCSQFRNEHKLRCCHLFTYSYSLSFINSANRQFDFD